MNISYRVALIFALYMIMNVLVGSEMVMNDNGEIIRIDDVEIDFRNIGVLKYDYKLAEDERENIKRCLDTLPSIADSKIRYEISGAKRINDCILITCIQSNDGVLVTDGGIDVVFSRVSKKILGQYFSGFRG